MSIRDFVHTYYFYGTSRQFFEAIRRTHLDYADERLVQILKEWMTSDDKISKKLLVEIMLWAAKNVKDNESMNLLKLAFIRVRCRFRNVTYQVSREWLKRRWLQHLPN
jgi:methionine salvage enolase-phosphatase E1